MKRLLVVVVLCLWVTMGLAGPHAAQKERKMMFVVSAGSGSIQKVKKGEYDLRMQLPAVDQVIMFGERPQHQVDVITGQELKKLWVEGQNNFRDNPPNALLSTESTGSMVVQILGVTMHDNEIKFLFQPEGKVSPKVGRLGKIVLTIDQADTTANQNTCAQEGGTWICKYNNKNCCYCLCGGNEDGVCVAPIYS